MSPEVERLLFEAGIPFQLHSLGTGDLAQFGTAPVVKSLGFRLPDTGYAIVALALRARADFRKITNALGVNRGDLRGASVEQLTADLDMQPGGIAPLPARGARVLLDKDLADCRMFYCGTGRAGSVMTVSGRGLRMITGIVVCQVS